VLCVLSPREETTQAFQPRCEGPPHRQSRHGLFGRRRPVGASGFRSFRARGKLLDLSFGRIEALAAEAVQLLSALPELQGFVQRRLAALEPANDLLQLFLGRLEGGRVVQRVSSTFAPNPPSASSPSIRRPGSPPEP